MQAWSRPRARRSAARSGDRSSLVRYQDRRMRHDAMIIRNRNLASKPCCRMAEERAPNGFARSPTVSSQDELESTHRASKVGWVRSRDVNSRHSYVGLRPSRDRRHQYGTKSIPGKVHRFSARKCDND